MSLAKLAEKENAMIRYRHLFWVFLGTLMMSAAVGRAADNPVAQAVAILPEAYRAPVAQALSQAGDNQSQLLAAIKAVKPEHHVAIAFLIANMPQRDLSTLTSDFLVENIDLAYQAREATPWARAIPEEIFLNDVLPYANLNEQRDSWRKDLRDRFAGDVKDCKTPGEAALKLNARIFDVLNVHYHATKRPKPDQSPSESMKATYASCTGLSILLVDACRAVGVPARTAGTPAWTIRKGDANGNHAGNHTWAEIWDGQWHFLGACENSKLSETWFAGNASKADDSHIENRIYAASFKKTNMFFPLVWDMSIRYVNAEDRTPFYTTRRTVKVKLTDGKGGDAKGHLTLRRGGNIVADLEVNAATTLLLSGNQAYQAEITPAGAPAPIIRDFKLDETKDPTVNLLVAEPDAPAGAQKPVKVYILTGQSNMEGHAKVSLLEYQIAQPASHDFFAHLQKDGKWVERDDVWIKFLDRKGKLTVGYGSPKCIGPELEFGNTMGDHYEQQVLLIKPAWGGRSLYRDFRPPSAGLPPDDVLDKMLKQAQKKKPETTLEDIKKPFGKAYRDMIEEVNSTLANLKTNFPEYQNQGYELSGLVWFQGWNDMIDAKATAEYADNMAHFIRDVRKDLKSPNLPVVIGQMGVDGKKPNANIVKFKEAEAQAAALPEFKGNVALVKTDQFWDTDAEAVFKKGWRENLKEWNTVGSDYGYHYYGSVKTMSKIGQAFAKAMLDLQSQAQAKAK
jgi:alpha-galactosidase